MKKKNILLFIIFFCFFKTVAQKHRIPAEWETQDKVWLSWFGQERRDSVTCRVIEALQPHVKLALNVASDSIKTVAVKYMKKYKVNTDKVEFTIDPYVDFFTRDYMFFVKDKKEKLAMVCFDYSGYGLISREAMSEEEKKFGQWDERLAKQLNIPLINSDYVFEGGGIEANGKGTFLIIKEMALQRNPNKTILEIENELKRTLGARKIIWLANGLIEDKQFPNSAPFFKNYFGGGANMHVDELCRFVNEDTVILPYTSEKDRNNSPVDSLNYPIFETNLTLLQNTTSADGKKLKIVRVPTPEIEQLKFTLTVSKTDANYFKSFGLNIGDMIYRVPAVSYCNFFISNKVVLIPKYWKKGMSETQKQKDEEVRKIFAQLFPDRQVIQIFTLQVNRGGGGIHCMTHEVPISK